MPTPTVFHNRLAGKVAIVTGAGSEGGGIGTGKAISCLFAWEGAKVCLVDRETERAEATRQMITAQGGEAFVHTADVTDDNACARAIEETITTYGKLDVLVNNVGIGLGGGPVETMDDGVWRQVMAVNLDSAVSMTRHALPHLLESKGNIVNISSIAALRSHGGGIAYSSSKAALQAMTNDLAVMYGPRGVRANVVAPGHIFTPLVERMLNEKARTTRRRIAPLQIEGDAWDVASAALFLASEEARFVTATCLPVDGGVSQLGALAALALVAEGG